ncbi:hypothetical protein [Rhizobium sp. Leaf386]|uniref:hypothetical protein n=1 Tax=Rhizobium sp. Leaf386 TaxID=1736359 RepID=UPI000715040F|nr:hypothetical protein [Rhizobium sp. Leaf386]KQS95338.1 hypothetical protein ASG50_25260 [Rhizobium sp. Leaf386]
MTPDVTTVIADLRARAKHRADLHNLQPYRGTYLITAELTESIAADLLEAAQAPTLSIEQLAAFKSAFYCNTGDETDDPFLAAFGAIGFLIEERRA